MKATPILAATHPVGGIIAQPSTVALEGTKVVYCKTLLPPSTTFESMPLLSSFSFPEGEKQLFGGALNQMADFLFIRCKKCGSYDIPVKNPPCLTPPGPYCPFLISGDRLSYFTSSPSKPLDEISVGPRAKS